MFKIYRPARDARRALDFLHLAATQAMIVAVLHELGPLGPEEFAPAVGLPFKTIKSDLLVALLVLERSGVVERTEKYGMGFAFKLTEKGAAMGGEMMSPPKMR